MVRRERWVPVQRNIIIALADDSFSIFTTDVDGDGDATAMRRRRGRALGDDTVAWNDGSQSSTERTIATLADGPTDTPRRVAQLPPW